MKTEIAFKRAMMDYTLSVDYSYVVWDVSRLLKLDPSERVAIRYYVGMWMAWIIANIIYDIDYLCHQC